MVRDSNIFSPPVATCTTTSLLLLAGPFPRSLQSYRSPWVWLHKRENPIGANGSTPGLPSLLPGPFSISLLQLHLLLLPVDLIDIPKPPPYRVSTHPLGLSYPQVSSTPSRDNQNQPTHLNSSPFSRYPLPFPPSQNQLIESMAATPSTMPSLSLFNQFHTLDKLTEISPQKPKEEHNLSKLLRRCKTTDHFKQIHGKFLKLGLHPNTTHFHKLLKSSSNLGNIQYTHSLFHQIDHPSSDDFNVLLKAYSNSTSTTHLDHAISLFMEMQRSGLHPDTFSVSSVLKACAKDSKVSEGTQIHAHSFKLGFQRSTHVQNSLINMYGSFGDMEKTRLTFEQLGDGRDDSSWSYVIAGYKRESMWGECLKMFREMRAECWRVDARTLVSVLSSSTNLRKLELGRCVHCALLRNEAEINVVIQSSLVDMYAKCGKLEAGMVVFRSMPWRSEWAYSAAILGLGSGGKSEEALGVFREMLEEGVKPDCFVCLGVLLAYRYAGLLEDVVRFFEEMRSEYGVEQTVEHHCCVMNAMCERGEFRRAFEFIESADVEEVDSMWRWLLMTCRTRGEDELVEMVNEKLLELNRRRVRRRWKRSDEEYVLVGTVKIVD